MQIPHPREPAGFLLVLGALLVLGGFVAVVRAVTGSADREALQITALRDAIRDTRVAADSCNTAVAGQETAFQAHDRHVDSLRSVVRSHKGPDGESVPADRYASYLADFDRYNQAVREWHPLAEALQDAADACRDVALHHNVLVDSLRGLLGDSPEHFPPGAPRP